MQQRSVSLYLSKLAEGTAYQHVVTGSFSAPEAHEFVCISASALVTYQCFEDETIECVDSSPVHALIKRAVAFRLVGV